MPTAKPAALRAAWEWRHERFADAAPGTIWSAAIFLCAHFGRLAPTRSPRGRPAGSPAPYAAFQAGAQRTLGPDRHCGRPIETKPQGSFVPREIAGREQSTGACLRRPRFAPPWIPVRIHGSVDADSGVADADPDIGRSPGGGNPPRRGRVFHTVESRPILVAGRILVACRIRVAPGSVIFRGAPTCLARLDSRSLADWAGDVESRRFG